MEGVEVRPYSPPSEGSKAGEYAVPQNSVVTRAALVYDRPYSFQRKERESVFH